MYKIKEKIENKFIKDKERDTVQRDKAKIFMDMGVLAYQRIREGKIYDPSFETMCDEILSLDKSVYDNSLKEEDKYLKENLVCECGHKINEGNKFCSQCGKIVEIVEEEIDTTSCISCGSEIDIDSSFCICCGSKLNTQIYLDEK